MKASFRDTPNGTPMKGRRSTEPDTAGRALGTIVVGQIAPGQVIMSADGRSRYQRHPRDGSLRSLELKLTKKQRRALKAALKT